MNMNRKQFIDSYSVDNIKSVCHAIKYIGYNSFLILNLQCFEHKLFRLIQMTITSRL